MKIAEMVARKTLEYENTFYFERKKCRQKML
jgi:hypothetical protein